MSNRLAFEHNPTATLFAGTSFPREESPIVFFVTPCIFSSKKRRKENFSDRLTGQLAVVKSVST